MRSWLADGAAGTPPWPCRYLLVLALLAALVGQAVGAPPAVGSGAGSTAAAAKANAHLADPTRPPMSLQLASNGRLLPGMLATSSVDLVPAPAAVKSVPPLPQLQGIQMGAQGRATAMLDGQLVKVGDKLSDKYGPWQVTAIDNQGVTLQGEQGPKRLSLLGGDKQPAGSIVISRSTSFSAGDSTWPAGSVAPGMPNGVPAAPSPVHPLPGPASPSPGRATHTATLSAHMAVAHSGPATDMPAVGQVRRTPAAAEPLSIPPLTATATPVASVEKARP